MALLSEYSVIENDEPYPNMGSLEPLEECPGQGTHHKLSQIAHLS